MIYRDDHGVLRIELDQTEDVAAQLYCTPAHGPKFLFAAKSPLETLVPGPPTDGFEICGRKEDGAPVATQVALGFATHNTLAAFAGDALFLFAKSFYPDATDALNAMIGLVIATIEEAYPGFDLKEPFDDSDVPEADRAIMRGQSNILALGLTGAMVSPRKEHTALGVLVERAYRSSVRNWRRLWDAEIERKKKDVLPEFQGPEWDSVFEN